MKILQILLIIRLMMFGGLLLLLGCEGDRKNPVVVECPEVKTPEVSEPEIIDISLNSFELLVLNAAEDSSEAFRSVQRKYERRPIRFSATIRAITEAARLFEDPGIYTYLLSFEESFKGAFGDYPIQTLFHLPNTIDLLFSVGDKITVTGKYEAIVFWHGITTTFYISNVEFRRE